MYCNDQTMRPAVAAGGHRGQPQPYVTRHDADGSTELTTTLIHAVANVTGADVTDVESMVYESIDPLAVNRLFDCESPFRGAPATLNLTIWGHHVTVASTGRITISPPQTPRPIQG
jgi:hypothetical protein